MKKLHNHNTDNHQINKARSLYYDFFARVFLYDLLETSRLHYALELMIQSPLEESLVAHCAQSLEIVQTKGLAFIRQEYTHLFVLPFNHHQIHLILSHYVGHNVGGDILLEIRQFFRHLPVRINEEICKESEEHFGFLMLLMHYLLTHELEESLQNELFWKFIAPFGTEIAKLLQESVGAFYSGVGFVLESFIAFEKGYLHA